MLDTDKTKPTKQKLAKSDKRSYRERNSFDDGFVNAYCNAPRKGKTAALLDAGFAGDNAKQEAQRMYKRLYDQITKKTDEKINGLAELAADQLEAILTSDVDKVGYSNMSRCIEQGLNYAGRKPGDKLTLVKETSIDQLDSDIERLQQDIREAEGKEIH